ncbi:MAG TPA: ArsA-related P-loop ATPase [Bryobacteraceae bacterium]|jgi:anion-transporting  ArsA/GET3 family ATPase|nr:ArsA-related P-loop ATPase [Bryobacteraceae bacterium]
MKIIVYLGTGGVGKTSVAAATAMAVAGTGAKSLVLTTDPSQRLRTALGLADGITEQRVPMKDPEAGELWAALLDVRATLDEAVRLYARAGMEERILTHPIYAMIANSLAGMQELMAIERIDQLRLRGFDHIIVDTAPSRHAFEILDKPALFADFSSSRKVKLVGRTYRFVEGLGLNFIGRSALDVYAKAESILGVNLVRQILDFYSLFYPIAEGYARRAEKTVEMLRDPSITEFRIVTTPQKALRDAAFFIEALKERNFAIGTFCVNRAWLHPFPDNLPGGLAGEVLNWYRSVSDSHRAAVWRLRETYGSVVRDIQVFSELERDVDGIAALERLAVQMHLNEPATA